MVGCLRKASKCKISAKFSGCKQTLFVSNLKNKIKTDVILLFFDDIGLVISLFSLKILSSIFQLQTYYN